MCVSYNQRPFPSKEKPCITLHTHLKRRDRPLLRGASIHLHQPKQSLISPFILHWWKQNRTCQMSYTTDFTPPQAQQNGFILTGLKFDDLHCCKLSSRDVTSLQNTNTRREEWFKKERARIVSDQNTGMWACKWESCLWWKRSHRFQMEVGRQPSKHISTHRKESCGLSWMKCLFNTSILDN